MIEGSFSKFNLSGKTALITGAAGLLGLQHASALLECGANVIITDINEAALIAARINLARQHNLESISYRLMNVSKENEILDIFGSLKSQGTHIDILVNNAAIDPKVNSNSELIENSRLENFKISEWNLQIEVGLTGAFLCSKVFGSEMARSNLGGIILNIASDLSVFSPDQRLYEKQGVNRLNQPVKPVTYSVIKTGLIGLTRYLSTYWAEYGVRCNALSPGGVFNGQSEEFVQRISSLIPLGRMARLDEYKSAIQFLCSDASSYLNGQNIVMDGGRSVW
jgi:NAD(P)-dependent dehydrogenase (short-subunit alcohol dehydrogenase family)